MWLCTTVLMGWDPATPPPRIWTHIRGRYWSAKIDDISWWPCSQPFTRRIATTSHALYSSSNFLEQCHKKKRRQMNKLLQNYIFLSPAILSKRTEEEYRRDRHYTFHFKGWQVSVDSLGTSVYTEETGTARPPLHSLKYRFFLFFLIGVNRHWKCTEVSFASR